MYFNKNRIKDMEAMIFAAGKFFGTDDELWEANVEYFKTMMNEFIKTNGKQLIFLSSGAVYGDQKKKKYLKMRKQTHILITDLQNLQQKI